jgi:lipid-binding SYLF domain-containing protein
MKSLWILVIIGLLFGNIALASETGEVGDRVVRAAVVIREIMDIPEKGIPSDLLNKCACVAVIPSLKKAGFGFGASYGKGAISCRTDNGAGPWSAPSMLLLQGGSFGLQIGAQAVDLVLVIMNLSGLESMLDTKFTLGGDASVAVGPVGRTASAETDAFLKAQILAYSRARGLFGGLVVKGGVIRPDKTANHVLYGKEISPRELLMHPIASVPKDAQILVDELTRQSPKKF